LKKEKEERGGKTCKEGLGKKKSEKQRIKVPQRDRLESVHKNEDENPLQQSKDEGEKELRGRSLHIESFFEELCGEKDKGPGKGITA
jgi:hypothetical protein